MAKWIIADVAGAYEDPVIYVRHSGRNGKTAIEITGEGLAAILGDTLVQMEAALAIPEDGDPFRYIDWMSYQELQDACQTMMDSRIDDMCAILIGDRINDLSNKWVKQHIVEVELDADNNPTGRVKVDGTLIENVQAHYESK